MRICPAFLALLTAMVVPACAGEQHVNLPQSDRAAREAQVRAAVARPDAVAQINMQHLPLEVALQFLAKHLDVPMTIQWDELDSRGIRRDAATTTLNLFGASYADALRAALWLLRPTRGQVGCEVTYGGLIVGAVSEPAAPETDAQKAADAHIVALLAEPVELSSGAAQPAEDQFYALSFAKKMSLIVDWDELAKSGVKRDVPIAVALDKPTAEEYLKALIAGLSPAGGAVTYDIRFGMVRVSTAARLNAERAGG